MSTLTQLVKPEGPETPPAQLREDGDHVDVVPYNAYQDPQCAHYGLTWFWDRLREHGLLRLYYPELADDDRLFPTFVRMMSSEATKVILVVLKDGEGQVKDLIGISTWEPLRFGPSMLGHAGFIFREKYWNRQTTLEAGQRIMSYWFAEAEPKLDLAVGLIARDNVLAQRYVRALGWTEGGWLPNSQQYDGKPCDAIIWHITREQFNAKRKP
jgi:RimJ/RimL family protein N-acetyltransferase